MTSPDIILTQGFQQPDDIISPVNEISLDELGIIIFPNPVDQVLTINFQNLLNRQLTVRLMDMQGKILQKQQLNYGNQELDMSKLPNAAYLLNFLDEEQVFPSLKILKISNQ